MSSASARLDQIRGNVAPRTHNARTIAALAANPGCARRAVMDAAGADKQRLAAQAGFPAPFGQSGFALARGNSFESQVKADGGAELLRLFREHLGLTIPEASYDNLDEAGGSTSLEIRRARTRQLLARAAASGDDAGTMFDHPLLTLDVGGRPAYLEPDLIAFQLRGRFYVAEVKSFSVIDGQADGEKVAAAAIQSAVYVLALRQVLAGMGIGPEVVAGEVMLVCPENFSNRPTAAILDVRKQLTVLERQLARLASIDGLLAALSPGLTLDPMPDRDGRPARPADDLGRAIREIPARYIPECLANCEMCYLCRDEAAGTTAALGRPALDDLGGVEYLGTVLRLARGTEEPAAGQAEAAVLLRMAARLRAECLAGAG